MEIFALILLVVASFVMVALIILKPRKKKPKLLSLPDNYRQLLNDHVHFYRKLDESGKKIFEERVQHFLSEIRITGVKTTVEDIDRVLIGASAIIPIYAFPGWEYLSLNEVLLYPDAFSEEFEQEGNHRSIAGIVGSGALQHVMVLSQQSLREGFSNKSDKSNTAIHEFVHLIDKSDGYVDGIPELLLKQQFVLPWLEMAHSNIRLMMEGKSDIDLYGATNQAEFFAVVSEYFFERPDLLKAKHPELYEMLEKMFKPEK